MVIYLFSIGPIATIVPYILDSVHGHYDIQEHYQCGIAPKSPDSIFQ